MLTPEQMQKLQDALTKLADPVAEFIVRDVIRRIREAGEITRTAEYQLKRAVWLRKSREDLNTLIAKENPSKEILNIFTDALNLIYEQKRNIKPLSEDMEMQNILKAAVELADEGFKNITQTLGMVDPYGHALPLQEAYSNCADYAFSKVLTGAQSYNEAVYEATRNLIDKGVRVIDYESGVHTSVDAAIRRDVFGGMGLMVEQAEAHIHDEMGATGWELSAHEACAKDHEPYQGRQYTNKEYEELNGTAEHPGILERRIGTLNCKHIAFPIMYGIDKPIYSEEELTRMKERNHKGINFEGKHYTMYEATQMQRRLERSIRDQRRKIVAYEELPGSEKRLQSAQIKYRVLSERYKEFSKAAGLSQQHERLYTEGFGSKQEKAAVNAYNNFEPTVKQLKQYTVNGTVYRVNGHTVKHTHTPEERNVAVNLGRYLKEDIDLIPKIEYPKGISVPDFKGHNSHNKYDAKIVSGSSKDLIFNAIHKKRRQSDNFVIETMGSPLSDEILKRQAEKIFTSKYTLFVNRVIVMRKGKVLVDIERKKIKK